MPKKVVEEIKETTEKNKEIKGKAVKDETKKIKTKRSEKENEIIKKLKQAILESDKEKNKKVSDKNKSKKVKNNKKKDSKQTTKSKKVSVKEKKKSVKTKKTATKKSSKTAKKSIENLEIKNDILEYYDLPFRYNETVVKILAQTPRRLFVYWEISEKDKETYINAFGEDFFEKTYPVLLVHNEEWNYTSEVPINDFANSWYLDIKDPKSKYVVKLGRKFRNISDIKPKEDVVEEEHINLQNDFIYITDSNKLETPNDHILFEKLPNQIIYRNVKNGSETRKDSTNILDKFAKNYREADIKYVYYTLYGDEEFSEEILLNPSSGGLSSSNFGYGSH